MASLSVHSRSPRNRRLLAGIAVALLHLVAFVALGRAASEGERVETPMVALELWAPFPISEAPEKEAPAPTDKVEPRPGAVARSSAPMTTNADTPAPAPLAQLAPLSLRALPGAVTASDVSFATGATVPAGGFGVGDSGVSTTGIGVRPAQDPYPGQVLAWIERHKRYPDRGRAASLEGAVVIAVTLDRRGRVRSVDLVRSSGHGVLDDAALAQVREASPFPAAPADATWQRRRFEAPIVYRIKPTKA